MLMLMFDAVKMSNDHDGIELNKEFSNTFDMTLVSFNVESQIISDKNIGENNNNNTRNANNINNECTKNDNDTDFFSESKNINGEISNSIIKPTVISNHIDYNENSNENINHNAEYSSNIDDDGFDDFQAYFETDNQKNFAHSNSTESSHNIGQPVELEAKQNYLDLDQNMENDFADFTSFNADKVTDIKETVEPAIAIQNDTKNVEDDFEEFADFTTVEFNNSELKSIPEVDNTKNSSKIDSVNYKSLIQDAFPIIISDNLFSNNNNNDDDSIFINVFDNRICSDNARQLWNNLQQIDFNQNFSFDKWRQSTTFHHLLKSLKIDACNVITENLFLKPIFLNQILEPTNYDDTTNLNLNINATSPDSNLKSLDVFLSKTSINNYQTSNWLENSQQSTSTSFFDNLSQDLDLFETKYVNNKNNQASIITDDLIAEFDEILIDNLNKIPSKTNAFNKQADIGVLPKKETSTVLETLSPLKQNTEQVLSAEALRILTELPNLSMMRQKFQIKVDHLQHYQPMSNNN